MKLKDIFEMSDAKRSRKLAALKKVLKKLEKKRSKIETEIKNSDSAKKVKKLKIALKANKRHREKARKLIDELE